MLKSLRIQNFKQFKDITFDFSQVRDYKFGEELIASTPKGPLIKTCVLFGRNASGKSNMGFAIMDITFHLSDINIGREKYLYYLNADADTNIATFKYNFFFEDVEVCYEYDKTSVDNVVREVISVENEVVIERKDNKVNFSSEMAEKYGFSSLQWDSFREHPLSIIKFITRNVPINNNNPFKKIMDFATHMLWFGRVDAGNDFISSTHGIDRLHDYICRNHLVEEFEEFLRNAHVNEKVIEKTNSAGQKELYFKHKRDLPMQAVSSSGTHALILQFYWLKEIQQKTNRASFVFVDEFDAFYHYELAEQIYKLMKDKCPVQCVLTTHNTNLMNNNLGRPDTFLIITPKYVKSFADSTNREIRFGNNLEKLYMADEFDAK